MIIAEVFVIAKSFEMMLFSWCGPKWSYIQLPRTFDPPAESRRGAQRTVHDPMTVAKCKRHREER